MTIVVQQQPEEKAVAGRRGTRGNGKTEKEMQARLGRIDAQKQIKRAVAQAELEAQAAKAQSELAIKIAERREAQASRVLEVYEHQEKKRAPQFQIDQTPVLALLGALAAITFLTTAALTADGTIGAAEAAMFALPWFGFILFGAFEVAILAFMLTYYVQGSRIDIQTGKPIPATKWFVAMIAASALTVILSAYHVLDLYAYDWNSIDMWIGIGIRLTVAVFFVLVSKGIASVLFAKAIAL